jgi:hypothetical protein
VATIADNLKRTRERIERAAAATGRPPAAIRLIAVTKTRSPEAIREAYACGQRDFGENYVQELCTKAESLADLPDIRWHMIGHLQRNKARLVTKVASAIHTVDSARLAEELARRVSEGTPLSVLIEVNVGGEAQKSGCSPSDLPALLASVDAQPNLRLSGLMTVPPHTEDSAGALPYFLALAELREQNGGAARLPELSMGMTPDVEQAIRAGATLVRIGTAIFGERA